MKIQIKKESLISNEKNEKTNTSNKWKITVIFNVSLTRISNKNI